MRKKSLPHHLNLKEVEQESHLKSMKRYFQVYRKCQNKKGLAKLYQRYFQVYRKCQNMQKRACQVVSNNKKAKKVTLKNWCKKVYT